MSDDEPAPPERARTLVVRVWLPDRPGALGQVASRIGAVHGDVTAIDILERGGGRVVDELVVSLPESASVDLLAKEIGAVDGVAVEQIRHVSDERPDSATAVLQLAAHVAETDAGGRLGALVAGLLVAADADWAVAVRDGLLVQQLGHPPELGWLLAFFEGSEHLDPSCASAGAPNDVMWARLPASAIVIAAGRARRAVHERERTRIALLARVVDRLL
ncbi:MAG: hypothetical protein ABW328_01735 [Ilumatobacteraceae bacterium]